MRTTKKSAASSGATKPAHKTKKAVPVAPEKMDDGESADGDAMDGAGADDVEEAAAMEDDTEAGAGAGAQGMDADEIRMLREEAVREFAQYAIVDDEGLAEVMYSNDRIIAPHSLVAARPNTDTPCITGHSPHSQALAKGKGIPKSISVKRAKMSDVRCTTFVCPTMFSISHRICFLILQGGHAQEKRARKRHPQEG